MKQEKIQHNIIKELKKIHDIDSLIAIEEYIKESQPINLNTYINSEFDVHHKYVREELEHEVRAIYLEITNRFEPKSKYISHFSELYIEGYPLDSWIQNRGSLFNTWEIANIIFKLWTKEIVFN